MKISLVPAILAPIALLAACSTNSEPEHAAEGDAETSAPAEATVGDPLMLDTDAEAGTALISSNGSAVSFDPECVITETGIAGVENPATLHDFVESFPETAALRFEPVYMVDFGALCALSGGEDAICVIFESYDVEEYEGDIEVVAMGVYADQCRTAEGVGPGTSITDAVAAYGAARFGFSYDNEGREYVSFADAPDAYSFRAESVIGDAIEGEGLRAPGPHGGDYTGVEGDGYFETMVAQPDAELWEIWISTPR
ncbi:hypothetical protein [Parasphingopyxis lamellibrachiae]|uniref:Uncharacterized protein n=1 Tax=Parasphingopyxis lamellibrachiae TaxID=680125 RepID=A0A3D9FCZ4_9SPHN|nr:hypothetical protein [Parasphingopyxis lamellibrachiae]RED15417.1 hypothetical protein DFR46_0409 [Parasphingopyxis lamellibrachiae]